MPHLHCAVVINSGGGALARGAAGAGGQERNYPFSEQKAIFTAGRGFGSLGKVGVFPMCSEGVAWFWTLGPPLPPHLPAQQVSAATSRGGRRGMPSESWPETHVAGTDVGTPYLVL